MVGLQPECHPGQEKNSKARQSEEMPLQADKVLQQIELDWAFKQVPKDRKEDLDQRHGEYQSQKGNENGFTNKLTDDLATHSTNGLSQAYFLRSFD